MKPYINKENRIKALIAKIRSVYPDLLINDDDYNIMINGTLEQLTLINTVFGGVLYASNLVLIIDVFEKDKISQLRKAIGDKIKSSMKEKNINRSQLADITGLSREQIKWICDGVRDPSISSF